MAQRELSVTYGSVIIGGHSAYLLDGFTRHRVTDGTADSSVEFQVVVIAETAAELGAKCAQLEAAFRTPRQALTISQNGTILLQVAHDAAVGGFNTEPSIRKIGDVGDSGRSRRYTLDVRYETPADRVATKGLRESEVSVSYDASRIRTITISGSFTAVSGTTSARARYEAAIAAHCASVLTALSATAELIEEPAADHDYDDKALRFSRTYRELIFGQGQDDVNNDASIVDQSLTVSRRSYSEDRSAFAGMTAAASGNVQPLAVFDLRYEASIDATVTTDLLAKYNELRSWLIGQFSAVFSQSAFALTVDRLETDRVGNRVMVDMTAEGSVTGEKFVSRSATTARQKQIGKVFRGAWTGNPNDFYVYHGFDVETTTTSVESRFLSIADLAAAREENERAAEEFGNASGSGGGGVTIETSSSSTPVRIGIEGSGYTIDMVDVTSVVVTRMANAVNGSGSSGGTGFPGGGVTGFGSGGVTGGANITGFGS